VKGTKPQLRADPKAVSESGRAPDWLSKHARAEWRRIMPLLIERKILSDADMGSVENYCIAIGRTREIEQLIQASGEIDVRLFRMQQQAMMTARQLAAELGLTPVSRARPVLRDPSDEAEDLSFLG
jgi:P27 family predicted phage terminase small subunit